MSPYSSSHSPTTHSRTASEENLAKLTLEPHLNDEMPFPSFTSAPGPSRLDEDDLLDFLPPLGQSVVEEAEESFRGLSLAALSFAASPAPSPSPSSFVAGSPYPGASPSSSRSRRASPDPYPDPSSYFALSRPLYASPEQSWSRATSSYSVSSSSTPALSEASSSIHSTPAHSPAPSSHDRFFATYEPSHSPTLAYASASPTSASSSSYPSLVDAKPTLASRRPNADLTGLQIALPSSTSPTSSTLRGLKPASSYASQSNGDDDDEPIIRPVARKPRWISEWEDIAGVSSLAAAAAVESMNLSRSRERIRKKEQSEGREPGSPILLKPRKSSGFAF